MIDENENAPERKNDSATRTPADTGLTQARSLFDLDMTFEATRRDLIAKRTAAGADTPIGHRCSNLVELLDNYGKAEGNQKFNLEARIKHQMAELEARNKAQGE